MFAEFEGMTVENVSYSSGGVVEVTAADGSAVLLEQPESMSAKTNNKR